MWKMGILVAVTAMLTISARAEKQSTASLVIVQNGKTMAQVVVDYGAGTWEKQAASDLVKYIEMMTGAKPTLADTTESIAAARKAHTPLLIVGKAALDFDPSLRVALEKVAKKNPVTRADAIVVRRAGNRVLLAGSNDESHYFAVTHLLQQWGCRWYLPTEFGECIPMQSTLTVGNIDLAYAPPFEIRHYWLSWNAATDGSYEFRRRNFMTETSLEGMGHALGEYTKNLVPPGKTMFNVSFSDPKTASAIVEQIGPDYAAGKNISLAIEDGNYENDSAEDKALVTEYDPYMLRPSMTDAMLTLYNNVGKILREKYPNSKGKIGGMAYANVTLPPKIVKHLEPNVVMWLAPIDVDPIHGMDDPLSLPRREYKEWLYAWAKITEGRLVIYDYDQGMLVWRDLPNPSQQSFVQDVKHYRDAHILGVGTESRGAMATTFLNLYLRGQLMWNPDVDTEKLVAEFYPKFYGPAAKPMASYWNAIFEAWKTTVATEHEYMVAPVIYTPELMARLKLQLETAERSVKLLRGKAHPNRLEKQYLERMKFTRLGFEVLQNYMAMVKAAAGDCDFVKAGAFGDKAAAARLELAKMNPTFTTRVVEPAAETVAIGPAWMLGEVQQMKDLSELVTGSKGTLITKTPLTWSWSDETPLPRGWEYKGMDGENPKASSTLATQFPDAAKGWKQLRTDIYLQGQGVLAADGQSALGTYWYQTTLDLTADQITGKTHLMFPGLFNEAWLYVNGELVGHRSYAEPWWMSDYKFEWDVDLSGKLKTGKNVIALRGFNPHHFGGLFRRPFLYRAAQ